METPSLHAGSTAAGMRTIRVRVPARIDFAGGWSDVHHFSAREGGAVLNAAIDRYVEGTARWDPGGLRLDYWLDLPPSSHLGTSGAIDVAWLALTTALIGQEKRGVELAEMAYRLEKVLGIAGGKQDSYAAALGGFLMLRFGKESDPAEVEELGVPRATVEALERRCVLCDSGAPEAPKPIHELVWDRYLRGDDAIATSLRAIRESVAPARDALLAGDLNTLARQMTTNREATRRLHALAVNRRMDVLFRAGDRAGAAGSKPCGAGDGGYLLFLCEEQKRARVGDALRELGATLMSFRFA